MTTASAAAIHRRARWSHRGSSPLLEKYMLSATASATTAAPAPINHSPPVPLRTRSRTRPMANASVGVTEATCRQMSASNTEP